MGRLNSDRIHSGGSSILTGDMVATDLKSGKTGYSNDPNTKITGTSTAIDTSDANGVSADFAVGKTGYVNGAKVTGTRGVDQYTKVLLHGNGDVDSTSIIDETGKTWTATGTCKIALLTSSYNDRSIYFPGNNTSYLYTADNDDFNFGSGDFTIDFWIRTSTINTGTIFQIVEQIADSDNYWGIKQSTSQISFNAKSGGTVLAEVNSGSGTLSANTWIHIMVVRVGANIKMFKNGILLSSTAITDIGANSMPDIAAPLYIGIEKYSAVAQNQYSGHLTEFRLSKGIARKTAAFIVGSPYGG